MPRQEHVLSVFVASPGDVAEERDRLEEIIRELNDAWSRELCIRLELVRWETHAYPGVSDDAQAVVNEQIPLDYDLFVGIMWHRFGTRTGRAASGTAEEFQLAKQRYDDDPSSVRIMFYFKDEALPPSKVDADQLKRVAAFRKSLGREGVLHWMFSGLDEFDKLLRLHMTRQVQAWQSKLKEDGLQVAGAKEAEEVVASEAEDEEDDFGLLDLVDVFEDRFGELMRIAERIVIGQRHFG